MYSPQYVSASLRAKLAIGCLALGAIVNTLSILLGAAFVIFEPQGSDISNLDDSTIGSGTLIIGLMSMTWVAHLPLLIITAVFFLIWLYKATQNIEALGARADYTPGWAVGWWFIPFANLVMPYKVVKDVWEKSDPEVREETEYWHRFDAGLLFGSWWAFWIISRIAGRISDVYSNHTESYGEWITLTKLFMVFDFFCVVAAILCILIVGGIDKRQEERSSQLNLNPSQTPPMPPTFDNPSDASTLTGQTP
jgi:Ca2+/Na+ antiporter